MCPRTRESIWLKHTPRSIRSSETGFRRQQDSSGFFALIAREDRHYNEGNRAVRRAPTASTGSFVTSNATVFECRGLLLNRSRNRYRLERHRVPGPHDCDYLSPICRVIFCLAPNTSFRSETPASRAARTSRLPAKLLPRSPVCYASHRSGPTIRLEIGLALTRFSGGFLQPRALIPSSWLGGRDQRAGRCIRR
jgi:hypothetical protein